MLSNLAKLITTGFASLKTQPTDVHRDIYGRIVERGEDFFHPQKFRGIPVFDIESVYRHYAPMVHQLKEIVDIGEHRKAPNGEPLFNELYVSVIKRYISYIHMLPASEDHHHSNTGGLLTHSLEAAYESLRWSKERKYSATGMMDLDAQIKPIMDYCAWLSALLHDAGKIMRDISVDPVEVIHPVTKRPMPMADIIVSWRPQKESLTEWAKAHNVSAYSATFIRNRTHNRHNIDSSQILQPLLRGTYAMDYILSSPIKQELYSEVVRVLSGYTTSKDLLSESIRMGDSISTHRGMSLVYDTQRGTRNLSTASRIAHCIKLARKDWDWNRPKSNGWIIGGEAYLRWSSAIDSIIKVGAENQLGMPTDTRNVLNIMDANGFTYLFNPESPNDRIVKFHPGNFNEQQLRDITTGKTHVTWYDLFKMTTPQVIFSESPMPPSMSGVVYLPNAELFYFVSREGDVRPITQDDSLALQAPDTGSQKLIQANVAEQAKHTEAATKKAGKAKAEQTAIKKPNPADAMILPKPAASKSSLNALIFGDETQDAPQESDSAPAELTAETSLTDKVSDKQAELTSKDKSDEKPMSSIKDKAEVAPQVVEANAEQASKREYSKLSDTLKSIMDKNVIIYRHGLALSINANDAQEKLSASLKDILASLSSHKELHIDLMRPTLMTVQITHNGDTIKCIPLGKSKHAAFAQYPTVKVDTSTKKAPKAPLKAQVADETVNTKDTSFIPAQTISNEKAESASTPEKPEQDVSLKLLAKHMATDTLIHYLKQRDTNGFLTFTDDGKLHIDISAIPPADFRPLGKMRVRGILQDAGATNEGSILIIDPARIHNIKLETC
jgi:hypothetical protein